MDHFPEGEFDLIYADPPWRYEHCKTDSRKIENQYPTMSLQEICQIEIPSFSDCILFLWATSPKLAESLEVIKSWGFVYRTCAVWDKKLIGMGYYFRQQHELLLVATKGQPGTPDPKHRISSIFQCKRGTHSRKPDHFYGIIERMYPDKKRLELFARQKRLGWSSWGNYESIDRQKTITF